MGKIIGVFFLVFGFIAFLIAGDAILDRFKKPSESFDIRYEYFTERMLNVSVIPEQTSNIYSITMNNGYCDYATIKAGPGKPKNVYPLTLHKGQSVIEPFWCKDVVSIEVYTDKGTYIYEY